MDLKYELDQLMLYNPFKNSWLKPKNKHGSRLIIIQQYPRLAAIAIQFLTKFVVNGARANPGEAAWRDAASRGQAAARGPWDGP